MAIAKAAADARFDHYICRRDDALRGRGPDEIPRMLVQGLTEGGVGADRISMVADEQQAIDAALSMARAGDQASGMTPAKLEAAIKSATSPGEFARGGGLLRDIEKQGRAAFEQVSPPTGARLASIGLPVAAVAANPSVGLPLAGGVASLVGTRTGRRLAQGMTPQQQRVAALVDAMRRQAPEMAWQAGDEYLQRLLVASGQR